MREIWKKYLDELPEADRRRILDAAIKRLMEIEEVRFRAPMEDEDCPTELYWEVSGEPLQGEDEDDDTATTVEPRVVVGRVTESIYSGKSCVVALAEVQHCDKLRRGPYPPRTTESEPNGLHVVTSKTRYDFEVDQWANPIYIPEEESAAFLTAWCRYRSELEAATLATLSPEQGLAASAQPWFGDGYRLLQAGEIIESGDEYESMGEWCQHERAIGRAFSLDVYQHTRRKIV